MPRNDHPDDRLADASMADLLRTLAPNRRPGHVLYPITIAADGQLNTEACPLCPGPEKTPLGLLLTALAAGNDKYPLMVDGVHGYVVAAGRSRLLIAVTRGGHLHTARFPRWGGAPEITHNPSVRVAWRPNLIRLAATLL